MGRRLLWTLMVIGMLAAGLPGCADQAAGPRPDRTDRVAASADGTNRARDGGGAESGGAGQGADPEREPPPAVPRKVIGGVGETSEGCELPARFMMTAHWDARSARAMSTDERAGLHLACEVDSSSGPGVLRIWTGDAYGSDPRAALEAFLGGPDSRAAQPAPADRSRRPDLAGDGVGERVGAGALGDAGGPDGGPGRSPGGSGDPAFSRLVAGDVTGWQATRPRTVGADGPREAAFALPVDDGVLVVSLGPVPRKQYDQQLPVYVLAKTTIVVTGDQP